MTNFSGANFSSAKISGNKIVDCHFSGVTAPHFSIKNCDVKNSKFRESNLSKICFDGTTFVEIDFGKSKANGATFRGSNLVRCLLKDCKLGGSDFTGATVKGCNFSGSDLSKSVWNDSIFDTCNLHWLTASNVSAQNARFTACDFRNSILDGLSADGATFKSSSFSQCKLIASTFSNSKFNSCKLDYALLCKANFDGANLDGCSIFGTSVWGSDFSKSNQKNFILNLPGGNSIVTNSIEYSFFLYQCMENSNLKRYFESTSEKLVLILGRFTPERMVYIDAIRNALNKKGLIPVLFDFDKPETQDTSEVVLSLALISRFTIVDLSDPKCTPHEVATIAPHVNSPIAAVIEKGQQHYAMYSDMIKRYSWVLEPEEYQDQSELERVVSNVLLPNCESYIALR